MRSRWLRGLLAVLVGTALALGLMAPTSSAAGKRVWVSGVGEADFDGTLCTDARPGEGGNRFTSDLGPGLGLDGCWYFDFSTIREKIIDLPGEVYMVKWRLDERFQGTLNGRDVTFKTKDAVVVNWYRGDPEDGYEDDTQIAGGCYHPIHPRYGSGALVFIERVGTPFLDFFGKIRLNKRAYV